MTKAIAKSLKPGDMVKNILGDIQIVDRIEGAFIILKWVHEDGTLSKGEEWAVPCHLDYSELVKRA